MSRSNPHRKYPAIDVVALYSRGNKAGWKALVKKLLANQDVEGLKRTLYGVQAGMADAAKAGLSDRKLLLWFLTIQRNLEEAAKLLFRKKYPNPLDNPDKTTWVGFSYDDAYAAKKKRDAALEQFFREARF